MTGGLQIGGGITEQNAKEWIEAGASKAYIIYSLCLLAFPCAETEYQVIITSYLFPNAKFSLERLKAVSAAVGKDRLVVDVR